MYPESTENKSLAGQNTLFLCPTKASFSMNGAERSSGDSGSGSEDITSIPAMNFGSTGNPPKNDYGE